MLHLEFEVVDSGFNEASFVEKLKDTSPIALVKALSQAKSHVVAEQLEAGYVLGADTIVVVDNRIYGKPSDEEDLRQMISHFSNRTHQVMTGITVTNAMTGVQAISVAVTDVHFRKVTQGELDWYVKNAHYWDKAGGYAIQEHAALFITGIRGCYYNVVGLPVQETLGLLSQLGLDWKELLQ